MKIKWTFGLLILFSFIVPGLIYGQSDPVGITDTVAIMNSNAPRGGEARVEVYLNNDEPLYGISIPLRFSNQYISCDTVIFEGTKMGGIELAHYSINNQEGSVLFGGIVMPGEEPLLTGPGTLAKLIFSISPDAPVGLEVALDTGFVAPAGEFVLTGEEAVEIFPAFRPGVIMVDEMNYPPVITEIPKQYVLEGDTLSLTVKAYDRERDDYTITVSNLPEEAEFSSGTNILTWVPAYVGPNSSTGNPHEIIFTASDGVSASHMKVEIEVINNNREPQLTVTDSLSADAGDNIEILVAAEDPDYEEVVISVSNLPGGCMFDNSNPGLITWPSEYTDSGVYHINIEATDPAGAMVSDEVTLVLNAVRVCDLTIGETQGFVGGAGTIPVMLTNRVGIKSMQLLIKYDPTALNVISLSNTGTRTENWERFNVTHDDFNGRIWITGQVDLVGGEVLDPMPVGEGEILNIEFQATSNLDFAGLLVPVTFEFLDDITYTDNTFIDENNQFVGREDVKYTDGFFFIKIYDGLIGDINLNGLAFEISDLIYFNNHFIDPFNYPLEGERLLNSDINQDGRPGTLGDLVYFIRIISGDEEPPGKLDFSEGLTASVDLERHGNNLGIYSDWTDEIGAAMLTFTCKYDEPEIILTERSERLGISKSFKDGILKVLICDYTGKPIKGGEGPIIEIAASGIDEIELQSADLADVKGRDIAARIGSPASLPEKFELGRNYPNPFNPSTTISFALPGEIAIELKIYNIRGQEVKTLISKVMPAGYHEVVWDGKNSGGEEVSSGVYFYRLTAGEFSESRKMIMLK
jgi:hypothetical protein